MNFVLMGMLKKATSSVPCLRRSGFAQAGRHFVVLTYWKYAQGVNNRRDLWDAASNTAALLDDFFDHSRRLLVLKSSRVYTGFLGRNIQQAPYESPPLLRRTGRRGR
jgi:hypothetical protein